jgi:hypothetical protein
MGTIIVIGLAKLGGQRSVIPSHQPSASLASYVFRWAILVTPNTRKKDRRGLDG